MPRRDWPDAYSERPAAYGPRHRVISSLIAHALGPMLRERHAAPARPRARDDRPLGAAPRSCARPRPSRHPTRAQEASMRQLRTLVVPLIATLLFGCGRQTPLTPSTDDP